MGSGLNFENMLSIESICTAQDTLSFTGQNRQSLTARALSRLSFNILLISVRSAYLTTFSPARSPSFRMESSRTAIPSASPAPLPTSAHCLPRCLIFILAFLPRNYCRSICICFIFIRLRSTHVYYRPCSLECPAAKTCRPCTCHFHS